MLPPSSFDLSDEPALGVCPMAPKLCCTPPGWCLTSPSKNQSFFGVRENMLQTDSSHVGDYVKIVINW